MHSKIILTVDVEDWFQVENLRSCIPFSAWNKYELRVEKNTHRLLDLFDSFLTETGGVSATFFVLGWIAERLPHL
ncbi:MAG TPA: polysaccharide deacetylase, partial [Deltaproteobacteria bacterium]|nr:polysaccharide deacetylase [Deltaproteobacteria bacterium]